MDKKARPTDDLLFLIIDGIARLERIWDENLSEEENDVVEKIAASRNCLNGNHSDCGYKCGCSCHETNPNRDFSGACADGDHGSCKIKGECACDCHGRKARVQTQALDSKTASDTVAVNAMDLIMDTYEWIESGSYGDALDTLVEVLSLLKGTPIVSDAKVIPMLEDAIDYLTRSALDAETDDAVLYDLDTIFESLQNGIKQGRKSASGTAACEDCGTEFRSSELLPIAPELDAPSDVAGLCPDCNADGRVGYCRNIKQSRKRATRRIAASMDRFSQDGIVHSVRDRHGEYREEASGYLHYIMERVHFVCGDRSLAPDMGGTGRFTEDSVTCAECLAEKKSRKKIASNEVEDYLKRNKYRTVEEWAEDSDMEPLDDGSGMWVNADGDEVDPYEYLEMLINEGIAG